MPDRIHVPEDAPFTPEQREWLNRFFNQMFAGAPAGAAAVEDGPAVPVTIA